MNTRTFLLALIYLLKVGYAAGQLNSDNNQNLNSTNGTVLTDDRDGKTYKTVRIGSQTWMAENLNYNMPGSKCNHCETFGRLYNFNEALNACPNGWHLPSDVEWTTLTNYLGGDSIAGGKMKTTQVWVNPNNDASNSSGFNALPAGSFYVYDSTFYYMNFIAFFWTGTPFESENAWLRYICNECGVVNRINLTRKHGYSIRCIKD